MKTKTKKYHSHYGFHHRSLMYVSIALLVFCVLKFDSHVFSVFKQAYNQGMGIAATFVREGEMTRHQVDFGSTHLQTTSGF